MNPFTRFVPYTLFFAVVAVLPAAGTVERTLERTYSVAPGSLVRIDISGGPITATIGPAGAVTLTLKQEIRASSEAEADELLSHFEISATQQGDEVKLIERSREKLAWLHQWNNAVHFRAELTVPANVRLDLDTSGGSITVHGETSAALRANTSGGSITVDGGASDLDLDTSGGGIKVGRALGKLRADTSGGSIAVAYVGPAVTDVNLDTSGGGINVGVDPAAKLSLEADTSGGSVKVEGLSFEASSREHSHADGPINGGGARLRADTSGGSIVVHRAES